MKNNVEIVVRERGKVVARRESHNIWTQEGKSWLGHLCSFTSFDPLTPAEDLRIRYIGFGIGGYLQSSSQAFLPPLSVDYPGTNNQTNTDDRVTSLERPVSYDGVDWFRQIGSVDMMSLYSVRFTIVLAEGDISYGSYLSVPLSEIGLSYKNEGAGTSVVAYDVFDTVTKSYLQSLTAYWTLRL